MGKGTGHLSQAKELEAELNEIEPVDPILKEAEKALNGEEKRPREKSRVIQW
jgi:hypothetical protein